MIGHNFTTLENFSLLIELKLKEDVAGATFLSMATSGPELLINCISTFNSNGNIGVGTIVGSAVFNTLAIPALCGFFTCASIQLDWWSISRDCSFYCLSVIALIAVIYDSQIMWYEAAFLVSCYGVYLIGEQQKRIMESSICNFSFISLPLYHDE